ncbi:tetratricopeptide repeat protein [Paraburkholderia caballeronis]|uniref:protein O-GlcNAc transferase n=1 Tax=Paraburkholderia caballeronis TaxID=416943 RepID=A0A1H7TJN7_9BURK|nr:tetratricopeptide repeat protein [Paraburkholderia caballeronis]PXW18404.1 putative O-linked N-acetylglucosamine transferase (SPINDLY family) [Paraburkholderia caballeronis]PXW95684.1 putative O-linked N-acetylglucosamine transferase (SPINDLY family) [Paraburkholderia caballeronis]RAJ92030.1 putative O-linked N-acetylglucosamine transferase (SPINDLY family) [Paraburkholderia caballeronis]SEB77564.1 Predicted O-linked N-acetylglucosamine transferase, SPINDLY family [Paraburkholderia caballero
MTANPLVAEARARHLAGDLHTARTLYEAALANGLDVAEIRFRLGILEWQCGNGVGALAQLDDALATAPDDLRCHFVRAQVLHGLNRFADAASACRAALALDPASADLHCSLGNALQALGDHANAIDAYTQTLALDPAHADAANNLGISHRQSGAADAAERAYRAALAAQPAHASALTNLGTLLREQDRLDEAIVLLRDAVRVDPRATANLINLGVALCDGQAFAEATQWLARAAELDPHDAQAAYNLGNALHGAGRHAESAAQFRRAVALDPAHADAFNNLGSVCKRLGEFGAAADAFDAALRLRPDFIAARNNAANLLRVLGRHDDAEAHLRIALTYDPRHSATLNNLGNVLKDGGALDDAIDCYRRAVASDPRNVVAHSNLVYALGFQSETAGPVLAEALNWSVQHEAPLLASQPDAHARVAARPMSVSGRRLRVGYVGADFRDHCQALFLVPLLAHHDRERFEIVCYANVARPDAMTRRLAGYVDRWRDVRDLDDASVAQLIRDDGIDILVDLTMHMADGRLGVFARRPAPVQASWLAYPGTSGLASIDYRLTDPHLDPAGSDRHYRERSLRLADSFWCYAPLADGPAVNALPALATGRITFGCLNNPCKLTDRTLRLWAGVFDALPAARMVLMVPPGASRARIAQRMHAQGLDAARVDFVSFRPRAAYLATYHTIDVGLDTFPYNGHTTSLDALWMGVPVVTRVGGTAAGRAGLSQLANLDLLELAAHDDAAFVETAVALARDVDRLAALRESLRARLERSPLMDGARFARQIEAAFDLMGNGRSS